MKTILVGSTYFFKDLEDFKSKDVDRVVLIDNPDGFISRQTSHMGSCLFEWKRMSANDFVEITLKTKLPMSIGMFLVKEFCDEIGFTIEHLKQLKPIIDKLDKKYEYEKIIYEYYIKNNGFFLTDTQRAEAFISYKNARKE